MEPVRGGGEKKKPTKQPHSRLCRPLGLWSASPPPPPRDSSCTHLHPTSQPLPVLRGEREPPASPGESGGAPPPLGTAPGPSAGAPRGRCNRRGAAVPSPSPRAASSRRPRTAPRRQPPAPARPQPTSPCPASRGLVLGCPHPKIARALHPQGNAAGMLRGWPEGCSGRWVPGLPPANGARSPVPGTVRLPQALPAPSQSWSITWCSLPAV